MVVENVDLEDRHEASQKILGLERSRLTIFTALVFGRGASKSNVKVREKQRANSIEA